MGATQGLKKGDPKKKKKGDDNTRRSRPKTRREIRGPRQREEPRERDVTLDPARGKQVVWEKRGERSWKVRISSSPVKTKKKKRRNNGIGERVPNKGCRSGGVLQVKYGPRVRDQTQEKSEREQSKRSRGYVARRQVRSKTLGNRNKEGEN